MKRLAEFCLRHRWKLTAASILWLLLLLFFAPVDRWSVCGICGAKRFESELTLVPFPVALFRRTRIEPTPLSQFVQDRNPQAQCLHNWLFASSCRGAAGALARGPAKHVYSAATYPKSTNLLFTVEKFLGTEACKQWVHRVLAPDSAKQIELLAVALPQAEFSAANDFKNWLKEREGKSAGDLSSHPD